MSVSLAKEDLVAVFEDRSLLKTQFLVRLVRCDCRSFALLVCALSRGEVAYQAERQAQSHTRVVHTWLERTFRRMEVKVLVLRDSDSCSVKGERLTVDWYETARCV